MPPRSLRLVATAGTQENGVSVSCALDLLVDTSGEVSRTDRVVEYLATMGGEARRVLQSSDGTGSRFRDEMRFFDGALGADGSIEGNGICALLDVRYGGVDDFTIFAAGRWRAAPPDRPLSF